MKKSYQEALAEDKLPHDHEIVGVKNNREAKKYKFFGAPQITIDCKDIDSQAEKASQFYAEGCRVTIWQLKMVEYPPKKCNLVPSSGNKKA